MPWIRADAKLTAEKAATERIKRQMELDRQEHERETAALEPILPQLDDTGLKVEPFGGNTFVVRAVPAALAERDAVKIVKEIAEQAVELGNSAELTTFIDACRMVAACHSAIRAKQRLNDRQMQALLQQLDRCENPSHCPHGRPTWVCLGMSDLEKMFKRIV